MQKRWVLFLGKTVFVSYKKSGEKCRKKMTIFLKSSIVIESGIIVTIQSHVKWKKNREACSHE